MTDQIAGHENAGHENAGHENALDRCPHFQIRSGATESVYL